MKELNKFYQSKLGQKNLQIIPQLAAVLAQREQSRMNGTYTRDERNDTNKT